MAKQDPSGLGPDVNPYRYCGNSPTNGTDPTGLAEAEGEYNEDEDGDAAEEGSSRMFPRTTGWARGPVSRTSSPVTTRRRNLASTILTGPSGTLPTMDGGPVPGRRLGRIGFGLLEVISGSVILLAARLEVGTLGAATPVSVPVMICGAVVACHGADNISAGLVTMVYGTPQHTLTYQTASHNGAGSVPAVRTHGARCDIAVPIVATAGAAAAPEAAAAADAAGAGRLVTGPYAP